MFSSAALDGITTNDIDGTTEIIEVGNTTPVVVKDSVGEGAADDSKFQVKRSKHTWCIDNTQTSIFDDGVLCGNPFGKELRFQLKTGFDNSVCGMGATHGDTVAENICMLRVELEVQLLPNP